MYDFGKYFWHRTLIKPNTKIQLSRLYIKQRTIWILNIILAKHACTVNNTRARVSAQSECEFT